MIYSCCEDRRRNAVKAHASLNGIDFLEVQDSSSDPDDVRQRTLLVHFIKNLPPGSLSVKNVRIEGGERITGIQVTGVSIGLLASPLHSPPLSEPNVLVVHVSEAGDFSTYTLRLVDYDPPLKLDPMLVSVDFSFKVLCPSDFDCKPQHVCPPGQQTQPEISYLAKDYASFRQLMLDRMSALIPGWIERNPSDLGIALVEVLAYVADYLSYEQDAVATEAYLGTARRRTSIKRLARLVDYFVHEGSNARAWIQIQVADGVSNLPLTFHANNFITRFITTVPGLGKYIRPDSKDFQTALLANPEQFELVSRTPELTLFSDHNSMKFYTWGSLACCLLEGSTHATLLGKKPHLQPGDVLIFMEARGPLTGVPEDASPAHRQAVRLTHVQIAQDPLGGRFLSPPNDGPVDVTEIDWNAEDALTFQLCVSALQGDSFFDDVSVALGNIALADHGVTIAGEQLPVVPGPNPVLERVAPGSGDRCNPQDPQLTPARYRPALQYSPLTHVPDYQLGDLTTSVTKIMAWPKVAPAPAISLTEDNGDIWQPEPDLLSTNGRIKEFVIEVETDGVAWLRFGDDVFGERPAQGAILAATYRVGNGTPGNVGRETISHIMSGDTALASVVERIWNPLAAQGGVDPETLEQVRQKAPSAFQVQERAVTPQDYEDVVKRCRSDVQHAAATFRWTGSWRTVFLAVDRLGGATVDATFASDLRTCVDPYRLAGIDLEVDVPVFVPLEIDMDVCVNPAYETADVRNALLDVFSNTIRQNGQKGIFHPDNFTFGQTVYLSPIYAAAQSVDGVDSLQITAFQRRGTPDPKPLQSGKITLGRTEIARLDNDPNFPEHGVLILSTEGGR